MTCQRVNAPPLYVDRLVIAPTTCILWSSTSRPCMCHTKPIRICWSTVSSAKRFLSWWSSWSILLPLKCISGSASQPTMHLRRLNNQHVHHRHHHGHVSYYFITLEHIYCMHMFMITPTRGSFKEFAESTTLNMIFSVTNSNCLTQYLL